jgi:DNA-binding PadR family transcriptional regulator
MHDETRRALSTLEYHVLTTMAEGPRYGYDIRNAVEDESEGTLTPRPGSLYRVLARLMSAHLVREVGGPPDTEPHPGRTRKYYGLTEAGRVALAEEARRLREAAALAEERLGRLEGRR